MMTTAELRNMSVEDLNKELMSSLKEQFNLRMQKNGGQTVKPDLHRKARRHIARIKTILTEKSRSES